MPDRPSYDTRGQSAWGPVQAGHDASLYTHLTGCQQQWLHSAMFQKAPISAVMTAPKARMQACTSTKQQSRALQRVAASNQAA